MKFSAIYMIKNKINGKCYVGSAVNVSRRWSKHKNLLRLGKHHSRHLQNAWNKYGESAFEWVVLDTMILPNELVKREQYRMDELKPAYNVSPKAGSSLGVVFSPEVRAKMSVAMKGKKRSPEARANISAAAKKRYEDPEARAKLSAANKKNAQDPEWRAKVSAANKKKAQDPEWRAKVSAAQKGRKFSPEVRANMSAGQKGKKLSPEARANISAAQKKYYEDHPEHRAKMSAATKAGMARKKAERNNDDLQ